MAHSGGVLTNPVTGQSLAFRRTDEARAIWQTRPALKTEAFFETTWGLAQDGHVNERGMPGLLQAAVLMNEYADEFRLVKPPWPVQRALLGALGPIGRVLGRPSHSAAER